MQRGDKQKTTKPDLEQIKLDINARLEEYKALRSEIVATLTSSYQTMNITLTATGILVGSLPSILKMDKPYLLGIAAFVFHALLWAQLRYGYAVFNMSNHIIDTLAPAVRSALAALGNSSGLDTNTILTVMAIGATPDDERDCRCERADVAHVRAGSTPQSIPFLSR